MKKFVYALLMLVMFLGLLSCKGGSRAEVAPGVYVTVEYEARFPDAPPKYDQLLRQTHNISQSLSKADYAVNNINNNIQFLVLEFMDVRELTVEQAFQAYKDYLTSQGVVIGVSVYVSGNYSYFRVDLISPDVVPPEVRESIDAFQELIKDIPAIPIELADAVTTSVELIPTVQSLITSAPSDFTGANALKLPKATAALTEASSILTSVPEQVTDLTASLISLKETIVTVFAMVQQ